MLTFRLAEAADVPLIAGFIRDLAEYERLAHEVRLTEEDLAAHLFGERRYAEVLLAYLDGEAVGFALFFHNFSTFLARPGIYLEDLFVRPEARGKGIGKALMSEVAKLAVERGCARFEWWVLDWNEPAIKFYESIGAKAMPDWTTHRVTGQALADLASLASRVQ